MKSTSEIQTEIAKGVTFLRLNLSTKIPSVDWIDHNGYQNIKCTSRIDADYKLAVFLEGSKNILIKEDEFKTYKANLKFQREDRERRIKQGKIIPAERKISSSAGIKINQILT